MTFNPHRERAEREYFRGIKELTNVLMLEIQAMEQDTADFEAGQGVAAACNNLVMQYYILKGVRRV